MGSKPSVTQSKLYTATLQKQEERGAEKSPANHKTVTSAEQNVESPEDEESTPGPSHEDIQSHDDQQSTPDMTERNGGTPKKHVHFEENSSIELDTVAIKDKARSKKSEEHTDNHSRGKSVKKKFEEPIKTSTFTLQNPDSVKENDSSHVVDDSSKNERSMKAPPGEDQMRILLQGESSSTNDHKPEQTASTSQHKTTRTKGTIQSSTPGEEMALNASFSSKTSSASSTEPKKPPTSKTVKQKDHAFPNSIKHKRPPAAMDCLNLEFYMNRIPSKPHPGHTIDEMLKWKGKYRKLEVNHRYIQWLFPIPEPSDFNLAAKPLQKHEIDAIRKSTVCQDRFVQAYAMMLNFYGIQIEDKSTGDVTRCPKNWKKRFAHLNKSGHNYLRITRILKALDCFGFRQYQRPLVLFFLHEIFVTKELSAIRHGAVIHWIDSLGKEGDRYHCLQYFQELQANSAGNFNPHDVGPGYVSKSDSDSDDEFDGSGFEPAHTQFKANKGLKLESDVPVNNIEEGLHNSFDSNIENEKDTTEVNKHQSHVREEIKVQSSVSTAASQPMDQSTGTKNDQARQKRRTNQANAGAIDGPTLNLEFYRNKEKSKPGKGWKILDILKWRGKYRKLEENPYVFQWLFPIFDSTGRNTDAQPLEFRESQVIQNEKTLSKRFCLVYEMVLGFYGLKLSSSNTGEVTWGKHWKEGFIILSTSVEDHRRVTRILQSLECLGRWYYQYPLVSFLLNETFFHKRLSISRDTALYWIEVMADINDKLACKQILQEFDTFKTVDSEWGDRDDKPDEARGTVSENTLEQHMPGQHSNSNAKQKLQAKENIEGF